MSLIEAGGLWIIDFLRVCRVYYVKFQYWIGTEKNQVNEQTA